MVLTKEAAYRISALLCDKHDKKAKAAQKEFESFITVLWEKTIPTEVIKMFVKHRKYFRAEANIRVHGNGFNSEYVSLSKSLPGCSGYSVLDISEKDASKAKQLQVSANDLKEKYKKLLTEVEVSLLTLKTFKRIQESFPEAVQYLPKAESRELIINFNDVRAKLKTA